jgi:hypothetical protein
MKVTLTTVTGNTETIKIDTADAVKEFIAIYPKHIDKSTRVKVTCDLLGISGWLTGEA